MSVRPIYAADPVDPPTESQIVLIGELFVEREEKYALEVLAMMCKTSGGAASAIRTLRTLPVKQVAA